MTASKMRVATSNGGPSIVRPGVQPGQQCQSLLVLFDGRRQSASVPGGDGIRLRLLRILSYGHLVRPCRVPAAIAGHGVEELRAVYVVGALHD